MAEKSANESTEALTTLKNDIGKVEIDYLQIDKDVGLARTVTNTAKAKAVEAEENRKTLEARRDQADRSLKEKLGPVGQPIDRAEQLRKKATGLLEKSQKHQSEIDRKLFFLGGGSDGWVTRFVFLHAKMAEGALIFEKLSSGGVELILRSKFSCFFHRPTGLLLLTVDEAKKDFYY